MRHISSRLCAVLPVVAFFSVALLLVGAAPGQESPPDEPPPQKALAAKVLELEELPPPAGRKLKPYIAGFGVELEAPRALLSFRLVGAFDDNLLERIESGLATGLDYGIELVKNRRFWFNKTVDQGQLQVVAMYNAVNDEYLVNYKYDGDLISSRLVRDPEELRAAMTEIEDLPVFNLAERHGELRLRVRAELGTGSFLFFIPTLRATDWVEARLRIDDGEIELLER